MSEYKEFWIDNSNETNKNFFLYNVKRGVMNYNFDGAIHVIEYEAFEELKSEIHNIRTHLISECKNHKETQLEIEKLKKQNEILREALSKVIKAADFYSSHADCKRDSWSCKCSYCKPNDHSINVSYAKKFLKDVEGVG